MLIFIPQSFGQRLRKHRCACEYSQVTLGQLAQICHQRISQFESGLRFPTRPELRRLAAALKMQYSDLIRSTDYAEGRNWPGASIRKRFDDQKRFEPNRQRETYELIQAAWDAFPEVSRAIQAKIRARSDYPKVVAVLRRVACHSGYEANVLLQLVGDQGQVGYLSPQKAGFRRHPIVEPVHERVIGDCEFPVVERKIGDFHCVLFFQPTLKTDGGTYRLDALMGVRHRRKTTWVNLEVDGPGHDSSGEAGRQANLGLPTVRLTAQESRSGEVCEAILAQLGGALPHAQPLKAA